MTSSSDNDSFEEVLRAIARAPAAPIPTGLMRAEGNGSTIGEHYLVREHIGRGGMGDVYLATDTRLDRAVAIKLARASADVDDSPRALREARAIASVSHPNVVEVFEVGVHDDRRFIAMEYVEGETAADWVRAQPRSWREVLAVYRQAAHGVAAAHEAGLVHRDLKPANVLVGADGRVRVLDFGLVQLLPSRENIGGGENDFARETEASLSVAGTLGFIAPETYAGDEPDARADQFALCVSVWEALHGTRPIKGGSPAAVRLATLSGILREPRASDVPDWVDRALRRGLAVDPADRFPDMRALVRALDPATHRRRRRRILAALAIAGAATVLGLSGPGAREPDGCAQELPTSWNAAAAAKVKAAFAETGSALAPSSITAVIAGLDEWSTDLAQARQAACDSIGTGVGADRSLACLHRQGSLLDATVAVFESATLETVARHRELLAGLGTPTQCLDPTFLSGSVPAPPAPANAQAVAAIRTDLSRVRAMLTAGSMDEARRLAEDTLRQARELSYEPVQAEALFAAGLVSRRRAEPTVARDRFEQAYAIAVAQKDDALAADAARFVLLLVSDQDEVAVWLGAAEAAQRRLGIKPENSWELQDAKGRALWRLQRVKEARDILAVALDLQRDRDVAPIERVRLLNAWAAQEAVIDPEEGRRVYERTLQQAQADIGEDHPIVADIRLNFARCLERLSLYAEAERQARIAIALRRRVFGERSRQVGVALRHLAEIHGAGGDLDAAAAAARDSLSIAREAVPADERSEALALSTLGSVLLQTGRIDEGVAAVREAADLLERIALPHDAVAMRNTLTGALRKQGRYEEAAQQLTLALESIPEGSDSNRTAIASLLANRSSVMATLGRYAEAHADLDRATELFEAVFGSEQPVHGDLAISRGEIFLSEGQPAEATQSYLRAVEIFDRTLEGAHDSKIRAHANLALSNLNLANPTDALTHADLALAMIATLSGERAATHARVTFHRGEAIYWLGQRAEGKRLVEDAHRELASTGQDPATVAKMEEWLRDPKARRRERP